MFFQLDPKTNKREFCSIDPKTGERSVSLTILWLTLWVSLFKLLFSSIILGTFNFGLFDASQYALALSVPCGLYFGRKYSDKDKNGESNDK
jgi:hypothetical protein